MPAIAPKTDASRFDGIAARFDENVRFVLLSALMTLSSRTDHVWPNLAAIVKFVRIVRNASQMEIGRNRTKKSNERLFAGLSVPSDLHRNDPKYRVSGYFSLIANIEQGGRKTAIPSDFVTYMANVLVQVGFAGTVQDAETVLNGLIAEDLALSSAESANVPVQPETTVTVASTVSTKKPASSRKS